MRCVYKDAGRHRVFSDKSPNGLFANFLIEYNEAFKTKAHTGCGKCLENYWNNYLKLISKKNIMEKKERCLFLLKEKYNGIQLGANGQPIRNGEMTDETAMRLLNNHPKGEFLFDKIPDKDAIKSIESKNDDDLTLKELRDKYPNITASSKASFLMQIDEIKENKFN